MAHHTTSLNKFISSPNGTAWKYHDPTMQLKTLRWRVKYDVCLAHGLVIKTPHTTYWGPETTTPTWADFRVPMTPKHIPIMVSLDPKYALAGVKRGQMGSFSKNTTFDSDTIMHTCILLSIMNLWIMGTWTIIIIQLKTLLRFMYLDTFNITMSDV